MPAKPMLDDVELQQVQKIDTEEDQVLTQHSVPALEGDFFQGLGRRANRVSLKGVMTGPEAGEGLKTLRDKFRTAEPISFVADIATATKVDQVLIEEMGVRELAGRSERFEYALTLREFIPPPRPEVIPPPPPPPPPPPVTTGALVVEVIVEGQSAFDFSQVTVTVEGTKEDGSTLARTLTNRSNNVWNEENMPPGRYTVRASVISSQPMSGSAPAQIRVGQTTQVSITLRAGAITATTFLVHFRFDKAFVEPCMREVLKQVAEHARTHSDEKLVIVGHTDKAGSSTYNQSLSERRARAVFAYLTFGRDRAGALAEWNALRLDRPPGELPSVKDNWGLREAQHMLQDLGFYPGNVDGQDGPLTREAVRAYRCHKGLPPGTTVDDEVWNALIENYLAQDALAVPESQFFPNCPGETLKWLGCGEEDPLDRRGTAFRPSRRVELLFVRTDRLPCQVPQPDTFNLPTPGAVNSNWCLGPGSATAHCCVVSPHLQPGTNTPQPCSTSPTGPWCREPAEPGTITVQGSIMREQADSSLVPAASQNFVLITPNGEFLARESSNGEPIPARTDASGNFSFADKRIGVYSLEVRGNVLVRLAEQPDAPVKGNAVCKVLRSNTDRLDVVIINAPLLREIRLPAVAHLMTALHPATREVRRCPVAGSPPATFPQGTLRTEAEVRAAFDGANRIWRQARIRFDLAEANIVREAYAFRIDCEVDDAEFTILLERCAYPNAVNLFFFADLAGTGEAGLGVSEENGAALGVAGCAVGDRFQFTILGIPQDRLLDAEQTIQVLAHELGHYLNLEHVDDTPANADRLMLPSTSLTGSNRRLTPDEMSRARASRGATDDCVPLSLRVTGATQIGSSRSNHFLIVQDAAATVTVEAEIPPSLLDPARGALALTGGLPGATPLQRLVSAAATGATEVIATYTSVSGGDAVTARVMIRVVTFQLRVEGAIQSGGTGGTVFYAADDPTTLVTIVAVIQPELFCVPTTLVAWTGGDAALDPLRRTVSRANGGTTTVSATVAGTTRTVIIRVISLAFVANTPSYDAVLREVVWEGAFRVRADIPGETRDEVLVNLTSFSP